MVKYNLMLEEKTFEFSAVHCKSINLIIICLYRASNSDVMSFLHKLENLQCDLPVVSKLIVADDIEEEETDTILEQINDEIENEEDHDETDDPIVDDAEETSVFDISIGIEDDENPTPGPSTRMKRRNLN
ncbi:hypothetical protein JTB14_021501 [Gonioctena quinquepunctata]|nr:hypothetical protein JTB14_021501 [Gonioctena quinquepunctata]